MLSGMRLSQGLRPSLSTYQGSTPCHIGLFPSGDDVGVLSRETRLFPTVFHFRKLSSILNSSLAAGAGSLKDLDEGVALVEPSKRPVLNGAYIAANAAIWRDSERSTRSAAWLDLSAVFLRLIFTRSMSRLTSRRVRALLCNAINLPVMELPEHIDSALNLHHSHLSPVPKNDPVAIFWHGALLNDQSIIERVHAGPVLVADLSARTSLALNVAHVDWAPAKLNPLSCIHGLVVGVLTGSLKSSPSFLMGMNMLTCNINSCATLRVGTHRTGSDLLRRSPHHCHGPGS